MIAKIESSACVGIQAFPVQIEADVSQGLPQLTVVGLPDASIKESKERVRAAIKNSGFRFPSDRITINLAPADMKKEGPAYDLPIALGILAAGGTISPEKLASHVFLGELALDGTLRPFKGAIVIAEALAKGKTLVIPEKNAKEASWNAHARIIAVSSLQEVVYFLQGEKSIEPLPPRTWAPHSHEHLEEGGDFQDVKGQPLARRALEIAVAGAHNLLMIGSPGSGKTMLASRIPTILPPLTFEQSLEITKLYSITGLVNANGRDLVTRHPFRAPHHNISAVAMTGGGSWPKPGEVSLAHGGVLFLDEFPEFKRSVLETLRTPLEEGSITISRTKSQINYPSRLMLVAAMNPCPCGFLMDPKRHCRCSLQQIQKYQARVSGPILDRIDLHIEVPALTYQNLVSREQPESSADIRERIIQCRLLQAKRFEKKLFKVNSLMSPKEIKAFAMPDAEGGKLLERAMKELNFSARAYYKVLKMARTIADLADEGKISASHIAEALQYRSLDRQWT